MENHLIWLYDIHLLAKSLSPEQWQRLPAHAHEKQHASLCLDGLERCVGWISGQRMTYMEVGTGLAIFSVVTFPPIHSFSLKPFRIRLAMSL